MIYDNLLPGLGDETKVSIAIDCWASPNTLSFLGITAYYISEDWEYKEVLIGFEPVEGAHTGENLAYIVEDVLSRLKLTRRLLAITADNASNNGTLRRSLQSLLSSQDVEWEAEAMKVNCLAHVFHLSAKALLAGLDLHDVDGEDDDFDTHSLSGALHNEQQPGNIATTVQKV